MNPVIPKVIELKPSIVRDNRTLIWLQNQDTTVNWSMWDAVITSTESFKYWMQFNAKIIAATFIDVEGDPDTFLQDVFEISKKVSLVALSDKILALKDTAYWTENYNNLINLNGIYDRYPSLNECWNGTIEDAITIMAMFYRYNSIVDCDVPQSRRDFLGSNMKVLNGAVPGKVWVFTQFFRHKNYDRYRELKEVLKKNCANLLIDRIVLLTEKDHSSEWKNIEGHERIQQVIIDKRLTYADFLKYVKNEVPVNVYAILCNADIYFGASLLELWKLDMTDKMLSLLRWNVDAYGKTEIFGPRSDSQDTWVFLSDSIKTRNWDFSQFDFQLGQPGCDNAFNAQILRQKFMLANPSLNFQTFHLHNVDTRSYNQLDYIPTKLYINLVPGNIIHTRQELVPRAPPPQTISNELVSFEIKGSSLSDGITFCTMLEKEGKYKWEAGTENHYFFPKLPIYTWKNAGVTPNGLVYDLYNIYKGKYTEQENGKYMYWDGTNTNILTPLQKRSRMLAIPFKNTDTFRHPDLYILNYLARCMRLLALYPESSFWIPPHYTQYIEYFEWDIEKLRAAYFSDDTACWADEVIGYLPGPDTVELAKEDIDALRSRMPAWVSEPTAKVCTILTSSTITPEFIEKRIKPFLQAHDEEWVIQVANSEYASYESIFGSSLCIFVGGSKADKAWAKLWALPKDCCVIEFQQELEINGEFQHLAHVASLKPWIYLLAKGRLGDVQEQIMEHLEKWFKKNGDELVC